MATVFRTFALGLHHEDQSPLQLIQTARNTIDASGAANMPYAVQYFATVATG